MMQPSTDSEPLFVGASSSPLLPQAMMSRARPEAEGRGCSAARDARLDLLKFVAIGGMIVEHSSRLFPGWFPHAMNWANLWVWPVFTIALGVNLIHHSKNPWAMVERVLLLGVISQIPFGVYFGHMLNPNPILCMGAGMVVWLLFQRLPKNVWTPRGGRWLYVVYPGHLVLLIILKYWLQSN